MWTRRQLMDGIRWRARTGGPWRDVPERYGPRDRVHDLFRRWQRDGAWAGILTQLQAGADAQGLITWDVNVDSTVCRAHRHAAGTAKKRGSPQGAARRDLRRAGRPRPRTLPGRSEQQNPPRGRAGAKAPVRRGHGWAAGRLAAGALTPDLGHTRHWILRI
ncbi:transposase [Streptomyces sp. TG1A-8]|uniref:transposase n=1 Tax=Streptomyces sp. TG1A-8 TaxID=3051385 RepID=UPI00265BD256|nr:transposase [Streptomyces sp. TG1A-8]MDO0924124.1 transposase [Streptomyces sp. TG1A-8]